MALEALNSPTTPSASKFNHQQQQDDSWSKRKRTKRPRSSDDEYLAFCLLMLARGKNNNSDSDSNSNSNFNFKPSPTPPPLTSSNQLSYSCKVCEKSFSSFQALGGHKASHRKSFNSAADHNPPPPPHPASSSEVPSTSNNNNAARTHECSICHKTFSCGQALGGHKRCHYEGTINHHKNTTTTLTVSTTTTTTTTTTTQSQSRSQSRCDGLGFEFDLNLPASPELGSREGSGVAKEEGKKSSREEEVESALPVKKPRLSLALQVSHSD